MSANVDAMVREGINAYKAGRKEEARALLLKATELDQYNEAGMALAQRVDGYARRPAHLPRKRAGDQPEQRARQAGSVLSDRANSAGNVSPFAAGAPPHRALTHRTNDQPASNGERPTIHQRGPLVTPPFKNRRRSARRLGDQSQPAGNDAKPESKVTFAFSGGLSGGKASPFGDFDLDDDMFADGPFSASPLDLGDDAPAPPARRSTPSSERERRNTAPAAPRRQQTPRAEATRRSSAPRKAVHCSMSLTAMRTRSTSKSKRRRNVRLHPAGNRADAPARHDANARRSCSRSA